MKLFLATLLSFLLSIITLASALDKPTASLPAASGGIVCAMSLCPTATINKRDLTCPAHCKDNCKIIDDICCPGVQKAVCDSSDGASSAVESSSAVATPTAVSSSSSSSSISSIISSSSAASSSSAQPTPSSAAGNTASSSAVASTKLVLSSMVLMVMIALIVNAL